MGEPIKRPFVQEASRFPRREFYSFTDEEVAEALTEWMSRRGLGVAGEVRVIMPDRTRPMCGDDNLQLLHYPEGQERNDR